MSHAMQTDISNETEMVLTRIFDAPRGLVWQCWTDPAHLAAWWGPAAITNRIEEDFRPGGVISIIMLDPDAGGIPLRITIEQVAEGEWFTCHFGGDDHPQSEIVSTIWMKVTLKDLPGGRTHLTVLQRFPDKVKRDANMARGAKTGWSESFVKLDAVLKELGGTR